MFLLGKQEGLIDSKADNLIVLLASVKINGKVNYCLSVLKIVVAFIFLSAKKKYDKYHKCCLG